MENTLCEMFEQMNTLNTAQFDLYNKKVDNMVELFKEHIANTPPPSTCDQLKLPAVSTSTDRAWDWHLYLRALLLVSVVVLAFVWYARLKRAEEMNKKDKRVRGNVS